MVGKLKGNKQMFDITFPDGVRRGMGFDGHAKYPVVATRNGSTISERDWSRLSAKAKAKLVFDDLPESVRAPRVPSASDAEHRIDMLRHYLRGRGLDEESVEQACDICKREMEVSLKSQMMNYPPVVLVACEMRPTNKRAKAARNFSSCPAVSNRGRRWARSRRVRRGL
jgi:hypothetical protein